MIVAVLDPNILTSALLSPKGAPAEIIRRWQAAEFSLITSPPLIDALRQRLTSPQVRQHLAWTEEEEIDNFLQTFRTIALVVEAQPWGPARSLAPDDERVLECAVAGGAAYVVSGQAALLDLIDYSGIKILNPVGFLAVLQIETGL
jgi:hypothetical protein